MSKIAEAVSLLIDCDRKQNNQIESQVQVNNIKAPQNTEFGENLKPWPKLSKEERRQQRLNSELLLSIKTGNEEQFQKFLQDGASINATCRTSKLSACHVAVLFKRSDFLKELLDRGAHLVGAKNGCTAIHLAALKGNLECLEILIVHNQSIVSKPITTVLESEGKVNLNDLESWDYTDDLDVAEVQFVAEGSTALHLACRQLHVDCIEYLLDHDADIEAVDSYGRVSLDMIYKTVETIYKLNTYDQKSNIKQSMKSIYSSQETIEEFDTTVTSIQSVDYEKLAEIIIFFLVHHAALAETVQPQIEGEDTDWRATHMLHTAVFMQSKKLIAFLLHRKVDVEACLNSGDTPLQLAIRCGFRTSLDALLEYAKIKETLEIKDNEGRTTLLIATHISWNYAINVLLEAGASVTAITDKGDNTLHLTARTNNVVAMREILSFQESRKIMNFRNLNGDTPLMVAVAEGCIKCVHLLLSVGADYRLTDLNHKTIAHTAAERGHVETLDLILNHDSNLLNKRTKSGETTLHFATAEGRVDCVKLLLRRGVLTKIECCSNNRKLFESSSSLNQNLVFSGTALHYAAVHGEYEVLQVLVDHDSRLVNIINDIGWCPLHTAIYFNQPKCARYLIEHGANLSNTVTCFDGTTATAISAICSKFPDPITFLRSIWDASVQVNNKQTKSLGKSVLMDFTVLSPSFNHTRETEVLTTIVRNENAQLSDTLLYHPLTQAFFDYKQKKVATTFLHLALTVQLLFAISISAFGIAAIDANSSEASVRVSLSIMSALLFFLCANEVYLIVHQRQSRVQNRNVWYRWVSYLVAAAISIYYSYTLVIDTGRQDQLWKYFLPIPIIISWKEFSAILLLVPKYTFPVLIFRNTFLIIFEAMGRILNVSFAIILVHKTITGNLFDSLQLIETRDIEKLFSAFTTLDFFQKRSLFQTIGIDEFFLILCAFFSTIAFISYLLTTLTVASRNIGKINPFSVVIEEIAFLSALQIYLYDEKILRCLPSKFKKKIKTGRHVPHSLVISYEKYKQFLSNDHKCE